MCRYCVVKTITLFHLEREINLDRMSPKPEQYIQLRKLLTLLHTEILETLIRYAPRETVAGIMIRFIITNLLRQRKETAKSCCMIV